ncbi:MAG TPA: hypothetical protein VM617_01510 [Thermoanaerobaculia bacterium]|nr:hypothetical protein [Thermoanaerobaculia bacterium]
MTASVDRSTRWPLRWRLFGLGLLLTIVLGLVGLLRLESWEGLSSVPDQAFFALLAAIAATLIGLISALLHRSFRRASTLFFFALSTASLGSAVWLTGLELHRPSGWTLRYLLDEALVAHWRTITLATALVLLALARRFESRSAAHRPERAFGTEYLPLVAWALESTANLSFLWSAHIDSQLAWLLFHADSALAGTFGLGIAILSSLTLAILRGRATRSKGLFVALLAVVTALADRAFFLVLLARIWALQEGGG